MVSRESTPVQKRYRDILTLHDETGVTLTPEDLAELTGGQPEDFAGIEVVLHSEELALLAQQQAERHLRMAGFGSHPDGGLIGFALIAEDVKKGVSWLVGKFEK